MRTLKRLLSRIYDLPNAFRVLDIMDRAGCDIEPVESEGFPPAKYWKIKPKWFVAEDDAKDLQKILLGYQIKRRSPFWTKFVFRSFRAGCRPLHFWF